MNEAEKREQEEWEEIFAEATVPWTEAEKLSLRLCVALQWCEIAGKCTDGAEEAIANIHAVVDALTEGAAQPACRMSDSVRCTLQIALARLDESDTARQAVVEAQDWLDAQPEAPGDTE